MGVRRAGYYDWLKRPSREERDEPLVSALKKVRAEHKKYGVQSMLNELNEEIRPSYGKGYRICKENGLLTKRRTPKCLTKADPEAQKAEDLVKRDFTAEKPGVKVFTDITEVKCRDGKLYICGILDAFDSALTGFSMANHMRAELCTAALMDSVRRYGHENECILHSDRGSQFTSHLYRAVLTAQGFKQSMGRTGICYDNAKMESFWGTLKSEHIYDLPLATMTRDEVRHSVFEWIEGYYNRRRRHTTNENNLAPLVKRSLYQRKHNQVA